MQTYIAILGRQPELGLIELESVLGAAAVEPFGQHALLTEAPVLDRLGGSIKIGKVIAQGKWSSWDDVKIDAASLPHSPGKLTFGVSFYGPRSAIRGLEPFGLSLKKQLKVRGSVRYVGPKPGSGELTAAQLKFNGIPDAGFELIIAVDGSKLVVALTEQVQDIDAYAARDYGRPARSGKVGMLPPKLAQILINTTHAPGVYDPFCGTGVVLQETLLASRPAAGSDLSPEMVAASRENLEWLTSQNADLPHWEVELADAQKVTIPPDMAVVSEGYLGPNQTSFVPASELAGLRAPLAKLYLATLTNLAKQLSPGSEVAICLPAWRTKTGWEYLKIVDDWVTIGYNIKRFATVSRSSVVYARDDALVGRQILLLTRQ